MEINVITGDGFYVGEYTLLSFDDWEDLNLYGVHIFETDDLETFDLLEAQREKDGIEKANKFLADFAEIEERVKLKESVRKAEIRRIAEKLWIHDSNNLFKTFADTIKCARNIVDNFDAEFEKLEGK
jgi:hypothetical protein